MAGNTVSRYRQEGIIRSLFFSRPEAVELYYDRTFAGKLTGNRARSAGFPCWLRSRVDWPLPGLSHITVA